MLTSRALFKRRQQRTRAKLNRKTKRPRLSIFRSSKHIYAQIIDDANGVTLAAASTVEKDIKDKVKTGADREAATEVGKLIASRAKENNVDQVVFDRGGYLYHGRVKALAEGAREAGLNF